MEKYKLTYFDARGLAEVARLILAFREQEFEDVRVTREEWQKMKSCAPQGKLPMLEVDGRPIVQSSAIWRYLARKFDMYGADDLFEKAVIDTVLGTLDDLSLYYRKMNTVEGDDAKEKAKKETEETGIPSFMNYMETCLKSNTHGYLVGNKLSLADLVFFTTTEQILKQFPNALDGREELKALMKKIENIPTIKEWLLRRPKTDF